jgi:hypothetical protein
MIRSIRSINRWMNQKKIVSEKDESERNFPAVPLRITWLSTSSVALSRHQLLMIISSVQHMFTFQTFAWACQQSLMKLWNNHEKSWSIWWSNERRVYKRILSISRPNITCCRKNSLLNCIDTAVSYLHLLLENSRCRQSQVLFSSLMITRDERDEIPSDES